MPAPTTQTSTCTFCSSGVYCGSGAVAAQTDWWRVIVTTPEQETLLASLLAQRHEFLGGSGVNANGGVELRLGGAELHRDRNALDHLAGVDADHVRAHHALAGAVDHQLHEGALFLFRHGELERAERGLVDIDSAEALARLFFRQAHRGDVGIGEHR